MENSHLPPARGAMLVSICSASAARGNVGRVVEPNGVAAGCLGGTSAVVGLLDESTASGAREEIASRRAGERWELVGKSWIGFAERFGMRGDHRHHLDRTVTRADEAAAARSRTRRREGADGVDIEHSIVTRERARFDLQQLVAGSRAQRVVAAL